MNETTKGASGFQPVVLPNQCPKAAEGQVGRSGDKGQVPSERTDIQGDGHAHGQRLQPGNEGPYAALAHTVLANVTWVLIPFDASFSEKAAKAGSLDKFCEGFLDRGEQFIERCCADCAKMMRQCAVVPKIRGTPTVSLAKEIRQAVFPPMEEWLANGRASLQLEIARLQAASVREALLSEGQESPQLLDVGREQPWACKLLVMGINQVNDRAKCLVDYALSASFGGQVSLEARQSAWSAIEQDISKEVGAAVALTRQLYRPTRPQDGDEDHPQVQLYPGDERAYAAMAQAIRANVTWLLSPFDASFSAKTAKEIGSLIAFCEGFLDRDQQFVERCCEDCAEIVRQCAISPEVRGTPAASLAEEIRTEVFGAHDKALRGMRDQMPECAALEKKVALKLASRELSDHFQRNAPSLILQCITAFINESSKQAEPLLAYALAKSFGGQVSLERQQRAWKEIQGSISKEVSAALRRVPSRVGEKSVAELEDSKKAAAENLEGLRQKAKTVKKENKIRPALGRMALMVAKQVLRCIFVFVAFMLFSAAITGALIALFCGIGVIYCLSEDPSQVGDFLRWAGIALAGGLICLVVAGLIKLIIAAERPLPAQIAEVEKEISTIDAKIAELTGQESNQARAKSVAPPAPPTTSPQPPSLLRIVRIAIRVLWCSMCALLLVGLCVFNRPDRPEPRLVIAAYWGYEDEVHSLVGGGADVDVRSPSTGLTPLLAALMTSPKDTNYTQKVSMAKLLLERGANPNAKDNEGHTAVWIAASFQKTPELVALLVQRGATNWNVKDSEGQSALDAARDLGFTEIAHLFEDADQKRGTASGKPLNPN